MIKRLIFYGLILIGTFTNCQKAATIQPIFDCEVPLVLDSLSTQNTLLGTWEWFGNICISRIDVVDTIAFVGLSVVFETNNQFVLLQNDSIIVRNNYQLGKQLTDQYQLVVEPSIEQLSGLISFCDDRLTFNDGYRDLCSNIFRKTQ